MSDYTITGTDVDDVIPVPDEYSNTEWVSYTFPAAQDKIKASSPFLVKFGKPVDTSLLTNDNFELYEIGYRDSSGVVEFSTYIITERELLSLTLVEDPFEDIDITQDYNSISRELSLTLSDDLTSGSTFVFVVKDLVDTTGDAQVDNNVVIFATAVSGEECEVTPEDFDIDEIIIEDYTLVQPPLPVDALTSYSQVTCSISDGTIHVPAATETITLTYSSAVTSSNIRVTKEDLDTGLVSVVSTTIVQDGTTFLVTITMPNAGTVDSPIYIESNCLYTIDAIYATIQFMGVISPFYVPLNSFLPYTTAAQGDPILWARIVYMMSKEVYATMGANAASYEADRADAVINYTKYLILSMFAGTSTNDSFMLGELQVTTGQSTGGLSAGYYAGLLRDWEARLFGFNNSPVAFDPYYPRPGRFPHDEKRSTLDREWTTFDRRLD